MPVTVTAAEYEKLSQAYRVCFDNFATVRSEVATEMGVSNSVASRLLNKLVDAGLVCKDDTNDEAQGNARRGEYAELTYQCYETYDSVATEEAMDIFREAFTTGGSGADRAGAAIDELIALVTDEPVPVVTGKKAPLTNSQRRALVKLGSGPQTCGTAQSAQPYAYLVSKGLATAEGLSPRTYTITGAGVLRAATVDYVKYGS